MKKSLMMGVWLAGAWAAQAQQVEVDDMYFNRKDRIKMRELTAREARKREEQLNEESRKTLGINPTDSYSARNVNPEYVSRLKTNPSSQDEEPNYFLSGYQPVGVNPQFRNNNYYAPGAFSSPFYGNGWVNPGFAYTSGFGSPFAGGFSPYWGDPFMNPYWGGSRWSMSVGYGWNNWSPWGWNTWGSPSGFFWDTYYYNSWAWGPSWNMGWNNWGWNWWGNPYCYYNRYPNQVIIIDGDNGNRPRVVYGRRSDRSSSLNNDVDTSRPINSLTRSGREISTGRTRADVNDQQNYYDRSWRRNPEVTQTRSYWGNESNNNGRSNFSNNEGTRQRTSTWGDNNNSRSWSNNNNSNSGFNFNNSNSNSRSSSFNSGGNTRSFSAPSNSGSSGGGSRSRGRD